MITFHFKVLWFRKLCQKQKYFYRKKNFFPAIKFSQFRKYIVLLIPRQDRIAFPSSYSLSISDTLADQRITCSLQPQMVTPKQKAMANADAKQAHSETKTTHTMNWNLSKSLTALQALIKLLLVMFRWSCIAKKKSHSEDYCLHCATKKKSHQNHHPMTTLWGNAFKPSLWNDSPLSPHNQF